jgi:hypothetical protein
MEGSEKLAGLESPELDGVVVIGSANEENVVK